MDVLPDNQEAIRDQAVAMVIIAIVIAVREMYVSLF